MAFLAEKPLPEMSERLLFSTDVQRPYSGEFRTWRRDPITRLAYTYRMTDARFAAAEEAIRADIATKTWSVPHWHERTRGLTLTAGQTVINVDTEADYREGESALVWKGCEAYELVTIASVGASSITVAALGASYTGAAVMPANAGSIVSVDLGRASRGLMDLSVTYEINAPADLAATVWAEYDSYEVLGCSGAYLSPLQGVIFPNVERISGLGPVTLETTRDLEDLFFAVELSGHAWDVKRFLHQVRGMDHPFWVKAWGGALTVQAASSGAGSVTVNKTRAAAYMENRHIVIDGQYRQITAASDGASTQTLTLDGNLSAGVAAAAPTSLLSLVRANADEIEIQHRHGFSSRVVIPVVEERAL